MRYTTVMAPSMEFDDKVNELISKGWQPIGGVAMHMGFNAPKDGGDPYIFQCQALVKN